MSIRLDRIVTRGGDGGQTSLGNGARVPKSSARIEALGTLDEVNAITGLVRAHAPQESAVVGQLAAVQNMLFDMGADLCQPEEGPKAARAKRMQESAVLKLEEWVEQLRAVQKPLTSFVLPGGSVPAAWAHLARTQARAAERRMVALAEKETINPVLLQIMNRLSDYFFVLARHFNADGQTDLVWIPEK